MMTNNNNFVGCKIAFSYGTTQLPTTRNEMIPRA